MCKYTYLYIYVPSYTGSVRPYPAGNAYYWTSAPTTWARVNQCQTQRSSLGVTTPDARLWFVGQPDVASEGHAPLCHVRCLDETQLHGIPQTRALLDLLALALSPRVA